MTYQDRLKHRDLTDRAAALRERLSEGDAWEAVTREEGREIVALLDEVVAQLSPERRDRMMEAVVDEAAHQIAPLVGFRGNGRCTS